LFDGYILCLRNLSDYIWLHIMEKKMKNFVLLLIVACFVAGCPGKDPAASEASASATVTVEATPSAAPTVTASAAVTAAVTATPSANASVVPAEKK